MRGEPELSAALDGTVVKTTMSAELSGHGLPQVVRPIRRDGLVGLLRVIPLAREVAVGEGGRELLRPDGFDSRATGVHLAATMVRGPVDGAGGDLGLEDGRDRLGAPRQ